MASYEIAYEKLKKDEGGFSLRSDDPGGYTYMGITKKDNPHFNSYKGFRGWDRVASWVAKYGGPKYCQEKIFPDDELNKKVKDFIYENHWLRFKCDKITDQHLAAFVYDTCFNMGKGPRVINEALELGSENKITDTTVKKLNSGYPVLLNALIYKGRLEYVMSLKMKYKGHIIPLISRNKGLLTRINSFKQYKPYGQPQKPVYSFLQFWQ